MGQLADLEEIRKRFSYHMVQPRMLLYCCACWYR